MKLHILILVACALLGMGTVTPGDPGVEKGVVKGRLTDALGNPIYNATVVIADTLNAAYVYATSDHNGYYETPVPEGNWTASVQVEINYEGSAYKFDLHPENTASFTGNAGAIRNFTWKLHGRRPQGGYYGMNMILSGPVPPRDDITLTLTPNGPLADGSAGKTLTRKLTRTANGAYGIFDIPVGRYTVTGLSSHYTLIAGTYPLSHPY